MKTFPRRTAAFLAAAMISSVAAQDVRHPPSERDRTAAASMGWTEAADAIGKALGGNYKPGRSGLAGSVGNEAFRQWLDLYQWCELLSRNESDELARFFGHFLYVLTDSDPPRPVFVGSGQPQPPNSDVVEPETLQNLASEAGIPPALARHVLPADYRLGKSTIADRLRPDFLAAMTRDPDFLADFFSHISDRDYVPLVLLRLEQMWRSAPENWREYRNLALALAVVNDQRPPGWWPHSQVESSDVPLADVSVSEKLKFWIQSNADGRLLNDIRKLDAGELKFVVDAPIALSEMEWAQSNARFPRTDFGRAFRSISYREDRLESGEFVWNEGPYKLEAISRLGGICVDQAYFAMLVGKARGIPTLYFTGQGADGGHAWFGYLKAERRWDMDCGRYENQNYAVGEALDPQTWLPINDHELLSLAKSFRRTPEYLESQADLAIARMFDRLDDLAKMDAALDSAISVCPNNDLAWAAKGALMERKEVAVRERRAFHEAALKQFANNLDVKVAHQRALASLARSSGDEETARKVESRIIGQNRLDRSDLSVTTAAAQLQALLKSGDSEEAMTMYRSLLGRIGRSSGGDFFYQIVEPFFRAMKKRGDRQSATRAIELARHTLKPESGSVLDQEFQRLEEELEKED